MNGGNISVNKKVYPYKKRYLWKYLGLSGPEEVRTIKGRVGNSFRKKNRFEFHFAFSKYTRKTRDALVFTMQTRYKGVEGFEWVQDTDKARKVVSSMCTDRRRHYVKRKKEEQCYYGKLQRRMTVPKNTVSILKWIPLKPGEVYDWFTSEEEDEAIVTEDDTEREQAATEEQEAQDAEDDDVVSITPEAITPTVSIPCHSIH